MADLTGRPGPGGDPRQKNPEDNPAQASADATADEGANRPDADFTDSPIAHTDRAPTPTAFPNSMQRREKSAGGSTRKPALRS